VNWIFSSICIISGFFIACSNSSSSSTNDIFPSQSALPYYSEASFTPHWREGNDTVVFIRHTISDFHFTNQKGDTVGSRQLKGKIYVAGFFLLPVRAFAPV
jgi:protein SCO1/2